MNSIIKRILQVSIIAVFTLSGVACAANNNERTDDGHHKDYAKGHCGPKKLKKGEECKGIVSIIQKSDGTLSLDIIEGHGGKEFVQCELCPLKYHKKLGKNVEEYKKVCREESKRRVAQGKGPYCLVDTTMLNSTPFTVNQSLSSDCIWVPVGAGKILINPGCKH